MESEKDHETQFKTCLEYMDSSCKEMLDLDLIFNEKIEARIRKLDKRRNAIDKIGYIEYCV